MFIGFEDIDLSIRLYQSGMKVGTCGAISLIHDHPKPSSNKDKDYEKILHAKYLKRIRGLS